MKEFSSASNEKGKITIVNIQAILITMSFDMPGIFYLLNLRKPDRLVLVDHITKL